MVFHISGSLDVLLQYIGKSAAEHAVSVVEKTDLFKIKKTLYFFAIIC